MFSHYIPDIVKSYVQDFQGRMIVLQWLMSERPVQAFLVALVVLAIVGDAFARQTGVRGFAHP
jgi:hypothetical protein